VNNIKKHPILLDRTRLFFARFNIFTLILFYFSAIFLLSLVFAALYQLTEPESQTHRFYYWFQQALAVLSTVGSSEIQASESMTLHSVIHLIASSFGLLLPALFITAVINRLLSPGKSFVFKRVATS